MQNIKKNSPEKKMWPGFYTEGKLSGIYCINNNIHYISSSTGLNFLEWVNSVTNVRYALMAERTHVNVAKKFVEFSSNLFLILKTGTINTSSWKNMFVPQSKSKKLRLLLCWYLTRINKQHQDDHSGVIKKIFFFLNEIMFKASGHF